MISYIFNLMSNFINLTDIDTSNIVLSINKGLPDTNNGKRHYLQYKNSTGLVPLNIRFPKLKYFFGLSKYTSKEGDNSYSLSVSFPNCNETSPDSEMKTYFNKIKEIEKKIEQLCLENFEQLLFKPKKDQTPEILKLTNFSTKLLKEPNTDELLEKYGSRIQFKVPFYKSNKDKPFPTLVYISKTEQLQIDPEEPLKAVPKNSEATVGVKLSIYTSMGLKKIYTTMTASAVRIWNYNDLDNSECPFDDEKEEKDDLLDGVDDGDF